LEVEKEKDAQEEEKEALPQEEGKVTQFFMPAFGRRFLQRSPACENPQSFILYEFIYIV
jgi:hypothetical protein